MAVLVAINANTRSPCRYASPEAPRIVNADMFVRKRVISRTNWPDVRPRGNIPLRHGPARRGAPSRRCRSRDDRQVESDDRERHFTNPIFPNPEAYEAPPRKTPTSQRRKGTRREAAARAPTAFRGTHRWTGSARPQDASSERAAGIPRTVHTPAVGRCFVIALPVSTQRLESGQSVSGENGEHRASTRGEVGHSLPPIPALAARAPPCGRLRPRSIAPRFAAAATARMTASVPVLKPSRL